MKKLTIFLFLFCAVRLLAVSPVPFTEGVDFSFKINGTGTAIMTVYDETGSPNIMATSSGSWLESGTGTAWLRPGKVYNIDFWGLGPPDYTFSFVAPIGYTVYINGVATELTGASPGTGWSLQFHTVEIRPQGGQTGGMWGSFSGIALGKSITWSVGLGDLRTGRSAGGIYFKELDLANSPNSRARLYYAAPPANVGQIVVIKDGPSNQTLRQIVTPIGFTDIVDVTGGYEIRCYVWGQVSSWNGILYSFTGTPWKTIKVESPANNQLKITESDGTSSPVVRVSLLMGSGSTTGTGGSISYAGSYAVHTFTSSGTFAPPSGGVTGASYLVVGGGGGGGFGGGGAGSMEYLTGQSIANGSYSVTIGAGGAAETSGGNSTFNGTTAYGGGRGSGMSTAPGSGGSSGGGCANNNNGAPPTSGSGSNIHWGGGGDNGGNGWRSGGGGGAGGDGLGLNNSSGASQGTGGPGLANSITGSSATYAGGGAGIAGSPLAGGSGGGGNSNGWGQVGSAGAANTGSGGGGGENGVTSTGGPGGSGVVVVRYPATTMTWTLQEGDATNCIRTTIHTSTVPTAGQRDDVAAVYTTTGTYASPTNTLVAKTKYHYVNQAWGEELDSVIADPDTAALTTTYDYYTTSTDLGNYRRVKSVTQPTGNWTAYEYYNDFDRRGQLKYQFQPWLDLPATAGGASPTAGRVFYFDYTTDWTGRHTRPTLREEYITVSSTTTMVGQTTWLHGDNTGSGEPREYATIKSYRDALNYHTDYTETYRADADPDFVGRLYKASGANLAQVSGSVSRGTFNTTTKAFVVGSGGDHWREVRFNGSTSSSGANSVTTFDSQSCPAVYMIPNKTTLDVTIRIAQGYVYRTETWVWNGSGGTDGFYLMTAEDFDYDGNGNLTQRWVRHNDALTGYTYTNGRLTSTTDPTGTETQFTYDEIGRVATSVKKGASAGTYAAQSDITTTYTYDGANHVTQTVTGSSPSLTSSTAYDLAGRQTSSTAPGSYTTNYSYSSGGRQVTATLPDGVATLVTETYYDGQPKSLTGTAVVAQATTFARDGTSGLVTRTVKFGGSTTALVATTADWLGRPITEVKPGGTGSGDATSSWFYNGSNQLYKLTQPGLAATLYSYDTLGVLYRECLDVGGNNAIDLASSDRITEHGSTYYTSSGNWWLQHTTTSIYASASSSTPTMVNKVATQISGLPTNRFSRTDTTDIFGNVTSTTTDVDRAGKRVYTTTDAPDSTTDAVQIAYNGLLVSSADTAGITTLHEYDDLGRQSKVIDPRTAGSGTGSPFGTVTAYVSGTSQVYTVTDPSGVTQATYAYDSAGRVKSIENALNKYAYYDYTLRNEKKREWGDTVTPVEYAYDDWGHMVTMKTYRGGSDWDENDWANVTTGTADYTLWVYDEPTGLLKEKYDDASLDPSTHLPISGAKKISYTYTQAGQINVRTWARNITTDYDYSSTTGELTDVTYSGGTSGLTYAYNRLGQNIGVTQTISGGLVNTFDRCTCGKVITDYLDSTYYAGRQIDYKLHPTADGTKGRTMGYTLKLGGTTEQDLTYGYASDGRPSSFTADSVAFSYTYTTNSHLVAGISESGSGWSQSRAYLSNRNLLDIIETKISTTSKAKFDHTHDNLGRITDVTKTGALFDDYGTTATKGLKTTYGYNERSEVTSESTADLATSPILVTGRQDAYAYDNIGNRTTVSKTRASGDAGGNLTFNYNSSGYEINSLNQYKRRTVPGIYDVAAISTASSVTVSGATSGTMVKQGDYFFRGHPLNNSGGPVFDSLTITPNGGSGAPHDAFLPATNEDFTYDDDGNLLTDGRWSRTYDAENRLIAMETISAAYGAGLPRQKLEFRYDYIGRRAGKKVYYYSSGWVFDSETRYVYDGWNLIEELDVNSAGTTITKLRTYAWGLDLSGSLSGAGGVGGLLMTKDGSDKYLPMFDGNGNVHGQLKASDGSMVSAYEFDAFGNILRESGAYAATNPWRFSTKYADLETGELNYGRRMYSPSLGRFTTKDPIEERGGRNLYAFVGNNSVNHFDVLGMLVFNRPLLWNGFDTTTPTAPIDEDKWVGDPVGVTASHAGSANVAIAPPQVTYVLNFDVPNMDIGGEGNTGQNKEAEDSKSEETDEERKQRKKTCDAIASQTMLLNQQWAAAHYPQSAANPMSGAELRSNIRGRVANQVGGIIDTVATLTPGGFAIQVGGFIGATTQMGQNVQNGSLTTSDVALYGASSVNYANAVSRLTLGRSVIRGAVAASARAAGYVGVAFVFWDIAGAPLSEYSARNESIPALSQRELDHQWKNFVAPQIEALSTASDAMKCGDFY